MANNYQPLRGMQDILATNANYYNLVINIASNLAKKFGYNNLITPIIENSKLFMRAVGETSDIVSKETYSFTDRDGTLITLRPEFTASVVRALISNGLTQSLPQKFFSYGSIFRHERPQKCRYRQFNQINFEHFGSAKPAADVELITLAQRILNELGLINSITLNVNSLGDVDSRLKHKTALVEYFSKYKDSLSAESLVRLDKNPLRILDSKAQCDIDISQDAPKLANWLNDESKNYFDLLQDGLTKIGVEFVVNDSLVRGLDYYTHTVFEFVTNALGAQGTVLAGGRYDGLVEALGGPKIPAVGFAAGIERLYELKQITSAIEFFDFNIFVISVDDSCDIKALEVVNSIRDAGYNAELEFAGNLSKKIKRADKNNAKFCLLIGENELNHNVVKLKNMTTGEEKLCELAEIFKEIGDAQKS